MGTRVIARGRGTWEVVHTFQDPTTGRWRERRRVVRGRHRPPAEQLPRRTSTAGMGPRRSWPLEPLTALTRLTVARLEAAAGLSHGVGRRWATHGLTDQAADQVAIRLGLHPALIWSDW